MPYETFDQLLSSDNATGKMAAHLQLLSRLSALYRRIVPAHLAAMSSLANYRQETLMIHAKNSAIADKLKQLAPTIQSYFLKQGIACEAVKIKVVLPEAKAARIETPRRVLSQNARTDLAALHERLADSPLKNAVKDFLQKAAKAE